MRRRTGSSALSEARQAHTITLFRPEYSDVLTSHEIDSGEVGEEDVLLFERAGAGVPPDYREVQRKLRAADFA